MNKDLTSNPNVSTLEEVAVMGRTVYVSEKSEEAYVEYEGELVSMTNLQAWNYLMEEAKKEVIESYEKEKSLEQKAVEDRASAIADDLHEMAREIDREASRLKGSTRTDDDD